MSASRHGQSKKGAEYFVAAEVSDKLEFANYGGHICFTEKDGTTLVKRLFGMYKDKQSKSTQPNKKETQT